MHFLQFINRASNFHDRIPQVGVLNAGLLVQAVDTVVKLGDTVHDKSPASILGSSARMQKAFPAFCAGYDPRLPIAQRLLALRVGLAKPSRDSVAGIRHAVTGRRVFIHASQFTGWGVA